MPAHDLQPSVHTVGGAFAPNRTSRSQQLSLTAAVSQAIQRADWHQRFAPPSAYACCANAFALGVQPVTARATVWRIMLGADTNDFHCTVARGRQQYELALRDCFEAPGVPQEEHQHTWQCISMDAPRTYHDSSVIQQCVAKGVLQRIAHTAAVQCNHGQMTSGLTFLLAPILLAFFTEPLISGNPALLAAAEADAYCCFTELLARRGYQSTRGCAQLEAVVKRMDSKLHAHLEHHNVGFEMFAVFWITLLLTYSVEMEDGLRLWDAHFTVGQSLEELNICVCATILKRSAVQLRQLTSFEEIMCHLQELPKEVCCGNRIDALLMEARVILEKVFPQILDDDDSNDFAL